MRFFSPKFAALALFAATAAAMPAARNTTHTISARQDSGPKKVFAHFMVGIVSSFTSADWEAEIQQAKGIGIDGFALNIGKDDYTVTQLQQAYDAATKIGDFNLFISFDFSVFGVGDVQPVADLIKQFGGMPAQFKVGDRVFVSSFLGDGFSFRSAESASGMSLFACPSWGPDAVGTADADCGFQWNSWPSQDNKPIDAAMTLDGDNNYIQHLGGKPYMAGASPWFFTHYGPDSFNKNWLFKSDTLWTDRWDELLQLAPAFVEVVTWNDYGESSYIGPLHDDKLDVYAGGPTGARTWSTGHDHSHWATVAAPYIAAYKAGQTAPVVTEDHAIYYYRGQPHDLQCNDATGPPAGSDIVADSIFVTTLLTEDATVMITSGDNAPVSIDVKAGVHTVSAPMGVGKQSFSVVRGGVTIASGDGYKDVRGDCDLYDFNAYVGEVPLANSESPTPPSTDSPAPPPATDSPAPPPATDSPMPPPSTDMPAPPSTDMPAPPPSTDMPAPSPSTDMPAPTSTDMPMPMPTPTGCLAKKRRL